MSKFVCTKPSYEVPHKAVLINLLNDLDSGNNLDDVKNSGHRVFFSCVSK